MLAWLLISVLICVFFTWVRRARAQESRRHPLPPMYPALRLPFIGHSYILLGGTEKLNNTSLMVAKECERKGGVMGVYLGSDLYYVITDPEDVVTAANACLQKHKFYRMAKFMGDGLITSSGDIWKRHRRLLDPTFSLPVILGFLDVFNMQSRRLVTQLQQYAGGQPFDMESEAKKSTSATFSMTAFGALDMADIAEPYLDAINKLTELNTIRTCNFYLHSDFIYKLFGYKKMESEAEELIDNLYNQIIKRKRSQMSTQKETNTKAKCQPILDLLLSMDGALTDAEIKDEVITAVAAGFDTTSVGLTFGMICLGAYPDVQEKLLKEILEVVGPDGDVEKEHLNKLVYTEAFIKESARFYVGGVTLLRYVDKDVKLKNYTMRAGSQLVLMPAGTNFHPSWGPDRMEFKPERWLDKASIDQRNKAFGTFSWGKRSCIGKTYALVSFKVTLAHLVRRYRVKEVDLSKIKYRLEFVLRMASGHEISIENRT